MNEREQADMLRLASETVAEKWHRLAGRHAHDLPPSELEQMHIAFFSGFAAAMATAAALARLHEAGAFTEAMCSTTLEGLRFECIEFFSNGNGAGS